MDQVRMQFINPTLLEALMMWNTSIQCCTAGPEHTARQSPSQLDMSALFETGMATTPDTCMQRLMHTLRKVDEVLDTTADEMPGMAASVRLTGLELSDCILEFSQLRCAPLCRTHAACIHKTPGTWEYVGLAIF